jgi:hypothetical protein
MLGKFSGGYASFSIDPAAYRSQLILQSPRIFLSFLLSWGLRHSSTKLLLCPQVFMTDMGVETTLILVYLYVSLEFSQVFAASQNFVVPWSDQSFGPDSP